MKKLIVFVFLFIGCHDEIVIQKDDSVIPVHEPRDRKCHLPYKEPMTGEDRCRHDCDHELCDCDDECKKKCGDDEECYHRCGLGPCLEKYGKCSQKCEK